MDDGSITRTQTYSDAGNVTTDARGGTTYGYTYDDDNRLVSVTQGGIPAASYTHNAIGERVEKDAAGSVTHYHYDRDGQLIAESDDLGNVTREYIHLTGLPLALVTDVQTTPAITYVHADHLGTPQVMTDDTQAVVWDRARRPFGETESLTGTGSNNQRFPGQYFDSETTLHYNYFRDYDPSLGRYLQSDPIGLAGGLNTYGYALANPLRFSDIYGLDVYVGFYEDAAKGAGHIGIGLDDETRDDGSPETQGYYPTDDPILSPGQVLVDEQGGQTCKRIKTSEQQDNCVRRCRAERDNNPGTYNLFGNQCTSFARDCLSECGIPTGDYRGALPRDFYDSLP